MDFDCCRPCNGLGFTLDDSPHGYRLECLDCEGEGSTMKAKKAPKKKPPKRNETRFLLTLDSELDSAVKAAAESMGIPRNEWARRVMRRALKEAWKTLED